MSTFIANQIIKQARISIEDGQAKYNAYFVNTGFMNRIVKQPIPSLKLKVTVR